MIDLHDETARETVEAELRQVDGVTAVRLVPGYEREVDEVHVLVAEGRSPKHVVRDLQSVFLASFDITTDHRVFSVVSLGDRTISSFQRGRLRLESVTTQLIGGTVAVTVALHDPDGIDAEGYATGDPSRRGRVRAAANATLDAVLELANHEYHLQITGSEVVEIHGEHVAVALVRVVGRRRTDLVTGSAPVEADVVESMVRATLDATNRLDARSATSGATSTAGAGSDGDRDATG